MLRDENEEARLFRPFRRLRISFLWLGYPETTDSSRSEYCSVVDGRDWEDNWAIHSDWDRKTPAGSVVEEDGKFGVTALIFQ